MPKEMIVSVNGREKKIAIIENGRVTEFYIERGESTQGIVGNIYKGRVMRVLPGMQSAFVDIGLERDAFLYVSDFFDEEEEFERIVVDKKKTEGADDEAAQRAAAERIERARVERERRVEQAQEEAEPEAGEEEPEFLAEAPRVEDEEDEAPAAVAAAPRPERPAQPAQPAQEEAGGRGRRDRGRRRRGGRDAAEAPESAAGEVPPGVSSPANDKRTRGFTGEDISTPFVAGADSFERIVDEEESAAEFGDALKDARLQERLTDQTRAVEFDMDTTATAEVGSLLSGGVSGGGGFERIVDSDAADADTHARLHSVQPEVAASVAELVGDVEAGDAFASPQEFERVSDDESAPAAQRSSKKASKGAAKSSSKKGSKKAASSRAESAAEGRGEEGETAAASKKGASKKSA
jgi:hypothetical protein